MAHKGLESVINKNIEFAFMLLKLMIGAMVLSIFIFVFFVVRAARREMYLYVALINQMEATQQTERKRMNKSLAFASASHNVRASLAGITGLIGICHNQVSPGSELETNLTPMVACTKDLLGILNSILDTSKIEAGKMLLEEEEFDLAQLLEDVVDLYHPLGMKKGVDVVLDPYDGSVTKLSHVKGDRGKLKQILCNLLSNAVKFTSEGHVSVRVWARKPRFEKSILASNRNNSIGCISCFCFKNDKSYNDLEAMNNTLQQDPKHMEFAFEVNDTGKGIPKEKQKSVFENYVQVKETAPGQAGTGLGLGIVQSLIHLMGGEIGILDKEVGEKGTCFRFNTFLTVCETDTSGNESEDDNESHGGYISSDSYQHSGPSTCIHSPKLEGSHVVLFIQSDNRVVWIDKTSAQSINAQGLDKDKLPPTDLIISKPFHGSRLYQVINLLPEFGGITPVMPPKIKGENKNHSGKVHTESSTSATKTHLMPRLRYSRAQNLQTHQGEIQELGGPSSNKPLSGKKVLVAEENLVLRKVTMTRLYQLGATVILCENGEEVLQLVCNGLSHQRKHGAAHILPYDYILMDCEMPVMDGCEATRHIRQEEEYYGVHIPIIALTAHSTGEDASTMIQAGMDYYLSKPLNGEQLLEAIIHMQSK
ncbi:unnamed protein product [Ilex paraguariensis]|uniref:histidine kinase n=1 Tax=Ilex paraguariensis TaxID=185542 RepID=A0ABC8U6F6_9AQUA